jgi:serine/threonine protein kinase
MSTDLSFICPGCRTRLRLSTEALGKAVRCPKCGFAFRARVRNDVAAGETRPASDTPSRDMPSGHMPAGDMPAGDMTAGDMPARPLSAGAGAVNELLGRLAGDPVPSATPAGVTSARLQATPSSSSGAVAGLHPVAAGHAGSGSSAERPAVVASAGACSVSNSVSNSHTNSMSRSASGSVSRSGSGSASRSGSHEGGGQTPTAPSMKIDSFVGRVLGQYKIVKRLGRGAKGIVYEAEDTLLGRNVAVKVLAPEVMAGGGTAVQRFLLEARAASRLDHPNCVTVFNIGKQDEFVFFSMPLIKGGSALDAIEAAGGPITALEATRIVKLAARGLHAAHQIGIVHRDIKPGNIMLGENGEVRVADFGMAKVTDNLIAGLTEPGRWLGTPHYMSPEQCQGARIDHRADVYSLGATYYCLLAGRPPFSDINPMAVVYKQVSDTHPDPRSINPDIPGICVRIIDKAMAKQPDFRYQSAEDMAKALDLVESSLRQAENMAREAERKWDGESESLHDSVLGILNEDTNYGGDRNGSANPGAADPDAANPGAANPGPAVPAPARPVAPGRPGIAQPPMSQAPRSQPVQPIRPEPDGIIPDEAGSSTSQGFAAPGFAAPPTGTSSGRFPIFTKSSEPEWMTLPATVTAKFRFPNPQAAKDAWKFLNHDIRRALKPEIAMSMHRGQKVAILEIKMCQSPPEELRIIKALICARGEYLGVTTSEQPVADWLRKQIKMVKG